MSPAPNVGRSTVFPLSVLMASEACLSSDSEDDSMPQLVNDSSSSPSVVEVEVEVEADDGSPIYLSELSERLCSYSDGQSEDSETVSPEPCFVASRDRV